MNRSEKAKATLDSPFIKEAFEEIRKECFKVITNSPHDQHDLREDMYYLLRATDCLEGVFHKFINEGKIEKINLQAKRIIRS